MALFLGSDHRETLVTKAEIARVFPEAIAHAERPVLRTAAAPLFLLSRLVHEAGVKVVLTGEGADELFGGYDIFREAKIRRFWARQPASHRRPRLLERLYPYMERSPVRQRSITRQFFAQGLESPSRPGFGHDLRWRGTSALKRLFSVSLRDRLAQTDAVADLLADLPPSFTRWNPLAQDQYLEIRTLLSGYLLSSQGDRMLMAHSVEGRFPFLDRNVARLAESLPASAKIRGLDEKHVLKRAARGLVPTRILERQKQPYRAPDASALLHPAGAEWVEEVASESQLAEAGVFNPHAVRQLIAKCSTAGGQVSHADNMALVGVLSTQLLHHRFIRSLPTVEPRPRLNTVVDCLAGAHSSPV
jgi:asparagine synthase (glutamine-hydrolysing)